MSLLDDFAMMLSKNNFLKARADFYEDMATDFENGGQEKIFLAKRAMRYTKNKLPGALAIALIAEKAQHAKGGFPEAAKGIIPENERIILVTGWQSNQFVQALREASSMQGAMDEIKKQLRTTALSVSISCLFAVVFLVGWLKKIAPPLTFKGKFPINEWPKISQNTHAVSSFLSDYGFYFLAFMTLLVIFFLWARSHWTYESKLGNLRKSMDGFFPFSVVRDMNASAFLSSLASMLVTGLQVRTALEIMLKNSNPYMRVIINQMIVRLGTQKRLGDALNVGLFNLETSFRIEDFIERSSNVSEAIKKISAITLKKTQITTTKAMSKIALIGKLIFFVAMMSASVATISTSQKGKEHIEQHMYD